jgi:hypothetical protein
MDSLDAGPPSTPPMITTFSGMLFSPKQKSKVGVRSQYKDKGEEENGEG